MAAETGRELRVGDRAACSNDALMAEPQQGASFVADESTDMPLLSAVEADRSAANDNADGRQLDEGITCSDGGMEVNVHGSTVANRSTCMAGESPLPADSANMLSSGVEDGRIGEPAAGAEPGGCAMISTEAEPSVEGSVGLGSGHMNGSIGIDGGSASMSAADAGSVSLANVLEPSHVRGTDSREDGGDDSGGSGGATRRFDEDLKDVEGLDGDCEVAALPGLVPGDERALTDDEARLILGAQVKVAACDASTCCGDGSQDGELNLSVCAGLRTS